MPPCHCISYQCDGLEVNIRTWKIHHSEDQTAAARAARNKTRNVIESYVDDIGTHISEMTLTDDISGRPMPGGRMWSRAQPIDSDIANIAKKYMERDTEGPIQAYSYKSQSPPSKIKSRKENRVNRAFEELEAIDVQIRAFARETSEHLASLQITPNLSETSDPLEFTKFRQKCQFFRRGLRSIKATDYSVTSFKEGIEEELKEVENSLDIAEKDSASLPRPARGGGVFYDTSHHFRPILERADPIMQVCLFLVVACQVILQLPRRGCNFILETLQFIIQLAFKPNSTDELSPKQQKLLSDFPADIRAATREFKLDGRHTVYAVCPSCSSTYAPTHKDDSDPIAEWPSICTYRRRTQGRRCRERLLRIRVSHGKEVPVPIKSFVYFDFKDWQSGLMARPGIEDLMDDAWKKVDEPSSDGVMTDIFHGDLLRNFAGPKRGKNVKLFKDGGEEGRYAYSLCIDFFNPYTNKQSGKKKSVGIIALVCLNLPPDLRYKPENMYLAGVVPGPREPQLDQINHYLTPLIDDFCDSWEHGFNFSRTHKHPKGRKVVCAIVALVCDLPGARKAAGFAAVSHQHFCSVCHCTLHKEGYGCTNHHLWRRRTNEECREFARKFKEAETEQDAQAYFDTTGLRWSELLRLPYFEPARFIVVDAMHNLFLGLIKEHIQNILGLQVNRKAPPPPVALKIKLTEGYKSMKENEQKSVLKIHRWLQGPLTQELTKSRDKVVKRFGRCLKPALQFVCCEVTGEQPPTSKVTSNELAKKLLNWRVNQIETPDIAASTSTMTGHVITAEEMKEIWKDIRDTVKPSWVTSSPPNLGSASHGKLKADQWRAVGTIYLPLSLIRLWAQSGHVDDRAQRCKDILNITMSLFSAIIVASSQETSHAHAEQYLQHMSAYMKGVKKLFPDYNFHPNHHMAMHLPDYLIRYGPVHGWWTFPFERVIGMLQRTATNCKIGELEETMAHAYTRSANLRNFISRTGCPETIRRCHSIFNKLVNTRKIGSFFSDLISLSTVELDDTDDDNIDIDSEPGYVAIPPDLEQSLPESMNTQSKVQLLSRIFIRGLPYATSSTHLGNSCILVKTRGGGRPIPFRISRIFRAKAGRKLETFVAARSHLPLEGNEDPYSTYPTLNAQLWSSKLGNVQVFPIETIDSHFACCPIIWNGIESVVVLGLARGY